MSTQYDTELQQEADNNAILNIQDSILMKTNNVSQFNFLYKKESDTDWQEYVPTANDIQVVDGKVTIIASDFKAQSWFSDVREIKLPNKWNNGSEDVDVTSIGEAVFHSCSQLTNITIPDSVTSIGDDAFHGCSRLTNITIPDSVTSIGNSMFYVCSQLTNITIPDSVTSIGNSAFYGCSQLTNITIPDSVTSISYGAFYGCSGLTSVYITDLAKWCNILFSNVNSNPLYYAHNLYLNGDKITDLIIPDSVTSIGDYAFYGCSSFTSVIIPNGVSSIGQYAFDFCSSIEKAFFTGRALNQVQAIGYYPWGLNEDVIYAEKWPDTGEYWNGLIIARRAIDGGPYKETVDDIEWIYYVKDDKSSVYTIDQSIVSTVYVPQMLGGNPVTSIYTSAFNDCSISEVVMHNGITEIQSNAFSNCQNIQHLNIPSSVTSIASNICNGCSNLTSIYIPDNGVYKSTDNMLFTADRKTLIRGINGNVQVPNGTLSIGQYAFAQLPNLSTVSLPSNFNTIGDGAFSDCTNLVKITGNAKEICSAAFNNTGLSSAFLPNGVISVHSNAFSNCSKLVSAFICPNINYLDSSNLFYNCQNLTDVTISAADGDAYAINTAMFYNCSALSYIDLQGEITAINSHAFSDCSSLTSIVLPSAISKIDSDFFQMSGSNNQYPWLVLREKSVEEISVMQNYPWNLDKTHIWPGEKCTFATANGSNKQQPFFISGQLDADDLSGVHNIRKLEVGSNVTSIGVSALSGQSYLEYVNLPDSISSIGASAFAQCDGSLTSINIPSSVTSIGDYAFANGILKTIMFFGDAPTVGTEIFNGIDPAYATVYVHISSASGFTLDQYGKWQGLTLGYLENTSYIRYEDQHIETFPDTVSIDISAMLSAYTDCSPVYIYINAEKVYNYFDGQENNLDALKYIHFGKNVQSIDMADGITQDEYPDLIGYKYSPLINIKSLDAFITDPKCNYIAVNGQLLTKDQTILIACTTGHVEIPNTVSSVLSEVGNGYSNLTSITIPDSVIEIQDIAFYDTGDLVKLVIGNGLTSFSDHVFRSAALRDLSIGSSLSSIEFLNTNYNIQSIYVDPENQYYSSKDKMLLSKDGRELLYAIDTLSVTVPDGVEVIRRHAFNGRSSVKNVVLADTVSQMDPGIFYYCTNLENVNLGTQLTVIPDDSFFECNKLSSVVIPDTVISIGMRAFYETNLTSVSLPSSVLSVDTYAFERCSSLVSMSAYGLDTNFRQSVFNQCNNLQSVFISSNLEYSGNSIFSECQHLYYVHMPNAVRIPNYMFSNCISLSSMPDCQNIQNIGEGAFTGTSIQSARISCSVDVSAFNKCAQLKNVEIYDKYNGIFSVVNIGENAFQNCDNLSAFSITKNTELCSYDEVRQKNGYPWGIIQTGALSASLIRSFSTLAWYTDTTYISNMLSICPFGQQEYNQDVQYAIQSGDIPLTVDVGNGNYVFLKKLMIGPMVSSIADSAFDLEAYNNISHSQLAEIGFYKHKWSSDSEDTLALKKTGKRSFFGNSNLSSVQLPDEVTCINSKTFYNCTNLSSISLPSALTMFGSYIFKNDELLSSIDVPASVKQIGKHTFENCPSLEYAYFNGKSILQLSTMKNSFWDLDYNKIKCEYGMTTVVYSDGSTKQFAIAKNIPPYMFADSNIINIFVGEDIERIDDNAFINCSNLSSVSLWKNIKQISKLAFNNCKSLRRIEFNYMSLAQIRQVEGYPFNISENMIFGVHPETIVTYTDDSVSSFMIQGGKLKNGSENLTISASIPNQSLAKQIEIGTTVTAIGVGALSGCYDLSCVTIPKTVTSINPYAFANDYNIKILAIDNGVLSIGKYAFSSCSELEQLVLPNSIQLISNRAFVQCYKLKEVDATTNSKANILAEAFINCRDLESFTMSDAEYDPSYHIDNYYIEKGAFKDCTKLRTIHLSKYVIGYKKSAFQGCSELVDIDLSTRETAEKCKALASIGTNAFYGCSKLQSIYVPATVSPEKYAFRGLSALKKLHFIGRSSDDVKNMSYYPWGANKSIITADDQ